MKILIGLLTLCSISAFAADFDCTATLTNKVKSQTVKLSEFRGVFSANIDGFAFAAQIDQFENVGEFNILILDQKDGKVSAKYSGPAPVVDGFPATVLATAPGVSAVVTCKGI